MEVLVNQLDRTTRTGEKAFGNYTAHVRYDIEAGKMPVQITSSINHSGDEKNAIVPVRLSVSINTENMKCNLNSNDVDDVTTGFVLVEAVIAWLKAYATELKTELGGVA